jgi:hypothetical protein
MDWLICIGGGIMFGVIIALASLFSQWADEAAQGENPAYKRRDW